MNYFTEQALTDYKEGKPIYLNNMFNHKGEPVKVRTSKKVIQYLLAERRTYTYKGQVLDLNYNHIGVGVYEFWFA